MESIRKNKLIRTDSRVIPEHVVITPTERGWIADALDEALFYYRNKAPDSKNTDEKTEKLNTLRDKLEKL